MSMPPANFGRAFDLSSLGKPKESATKNAINAVTVENLMSDYVQVSKEKPVILLAYAERAAQTVAIRDLFAKLAEADNGTWKFGAIEVESQTQLVQALRIQTCQRRSYSSTNKYCRCLRFRRKRIKLEFY